ncbi:MAG: hypothetical protein HRT89_16330 [Lentisphaeria bacterium]|nr:hypothetical protein [Lentisphaeria bacterium]NQZ69627.1 hypothetical protein [Lentisphaeria bacterium]
MQKNILILSIALLAIIVTTLNIINATPEIRPYKINSAKKSKLKLGWEEFDKTGDPDKAIIFFNDALKENPQDLNVIAAIGRMDILSENYHAAYNSFYNVVNADPENHVALYYLTIALFSLERYAEAEKLGLKGLKEFPKVQHKFDVLLACLYHKTAKDALAELHFNNAHNALKEAIKVFPAHSKWAICLTEITAFQELFPELSTPDPKDEIDPQDK